MGNSATKEQRAPYDSLAHERGTFAEAGHGVYGSRHARGSQGNLTNIFSSSSHREREGPQDEAALAQRRETKAEREARRIERERLNRERERERSMKEESVDGGYLCTQGVYTGAEDYNKGIVRSLMIERRIAPFWRGLNDHSESWVEHQLLAAVQALPIPPADEAPTHTSYWPPADGPIYEDAGSGPSSPTTLLTKSTSAGETHTLSTSPPLASGTLLKGRAKTLASLTVPSSSRTSSSSDLTQREAQLPIEPSVNGQRLEAFLYKDATECPICFLYYPPYLNRTRCCDQPICSECFVQIKRPDPHPPEHHDDPNNPTTQAQMSQEREVTAGEVNLVSEPSQCPYCAQPEFGVTFEPPPIRRGLVFPSQLSSGSSPLPSPGSPSPIGGRKRSASLPATASTVITTDKVRPEWSNKLAQARAHAARRSAAATALHTAAYMMGGSRERRIQLPFRRGISSRSGGDAPSSDGTDSEQRPEGTPLDLFALMQAAARGQPGGEGNNPGVSIAGPRVGSRRARAEDIEEMMMMEAIRLSLASEEERRRKEEKDRAKDEKKKAKEDKKQQKAADKAARKSSGSSSSNLYGMLGGSRSNLTVNSAQPSVFGTESATGTPNKGKGLARNGSDLNLPGSSAGSSQNAGAQAHLERSRANLAPSIDTPTSFASRPTRGRSLSGASSSASSVNENSGLAVGMQAPRAGGSSEQLSTSGGGAGLEPMFNFRSLAAMIEDEEKKAAGGDRTHDGIDTTPTREIPDISSSFVPGLLDRSDSIESENGAPAHASNGHARSGAGKKHEVEVTSDVTREFGSV